MGRYLDSLRIYWQPMLLGVSSGLFVYGWLGYVFARKTSLRRRYLVLAIILTSWLLLVGIILFVI
ncbi:MAG: hypothetical protein NC911_01625 [Candidatus Omnitrophica bacterium]|nr:hypothetical protein [Candidatus Omnitrophota bacterium]